MPVPVLGREPVSATDAVSIVKAIRGGPAGRGGELEARCGDENARVAG